MTDTETPAMTEQSVFTGDTNAIKASAVHEGSRIIWPNGDEVTAAELQDALVAFKVGRRVEREEITKVVEGQMDAFLPSTGLNPAWIAGWHAAIRHAALVVKRGH